MKNAKVFFMVLTFCSMFFLSGCFFHKPTYYPARVLIKDGAPCFSVADRHGGRAGAPEVSTITIFLEAGYGVEEFWRRVFPSQPPVKISAHDCFAYGKELEVAPEFKHGTHYRVFIDSYMNGNNMIYMTYFCLYKTPDGKTEVHHAKWNDKKHERDWGMCE